MQEAEGSILSSWPNFVPKPLSHKMGRSRGKFNCLIWDLSVSSCFASVWWLCLQREHIGISQPISPFAVWPGHLPFKRWSLFPFPVNWSWSRDLFRPKNGMEALICSFWGTSPNGSVASVCLGCNVSFWKSVACKPSHLARDRGHCGERPKAILNVPDQATLPSEQPSSAPANEKNYEKW